MSKPCIAPHIKEELSMVIQGTKPLAILYKSKQPEQFDLAIKASQIAFMHEVELYLEEVRPNVIAIASNLEKIEEYKDLVKTRNFYTRRYYQYLMGKLFGYTYEECVSYINTETAKTCTCVECGGENI